MANSVEPPQKMALKDRLAFETDAASLWDTETLQTEPLAQRQRLLFFHQLARALLNGSAQRAPLPAELVRITLRLTGCMLYSTAHSLTTEPAPDYTCGALLDFSRDADEADAADVVLRTPPLGRAFLARAAQLRVAATERVCLWPEAKVSACAVHNFYFSVLLAEPASALPRSEGGRALEWQCCVSVGPVKGSAGRVVQFGADHSLWEHARAGDAIVVKAGPSVFGWRNDISKAELFVWEFFDPMKALVSV